MWSVKSAGVWLAVLLCLTIGVKWSSSVVTLENNGYKGLVVAISKDVPENPTLVEKIKDMISKASIQLYGSTKHRAFFEEVTIVVPPSWSFSSNYEVVQGGDRFSRAEVRVDKANPMYGDSPYTLQPGECGEQGEYIHLTPDFILGQLHKLQNEADGLLGDEPAEEKVEGVESIVESYEEYPFGDTGKVFVHEWAHLRFGTFDEHGYQSDEQMPEFYLDKDSNIHPTGCSDGVRGWLRDTAGEPCVLDVDGMPNSKCVFYPEIELADEEIKNEEGGHKKPSLMYLPGLNSADGFCEDDNANGRKHNSVAPTKQNIMCQGRSTWDVISKHPDFKNTNLPRNLASLNPKFRVIQPKKNQRPSFVLVLDTSGSMKGRRMELLRAATSRFIKYQLADFCMVGMVAFSTDSKLLSNMTYLDDRTREHLLNRVPIKDDEGFTAIGLGIQKGLKLLKDSREPTEGTLLLLVSDGEENVEPMINDVVPEILASKVIINTVAFGKQASVRLENLVKITGGRGFFYDDDKESHKMLDTAFVESAATHADVELRPLEIVNKNMMLKGGEKFEGHFIIDKEIGNKTAFLLTYDIPVDPKDPEPVELIVWSPMGKKYTTGSLEFSSDRNTLSLSVKLNQASDGKWTYYIKNRISQDMDFTVLVSSETSDIKEQPVRVRSWVSDLDFNFPSRVKVYAEVKKGYNPIVDATVIGTVGRPLGEPWIMMLFDNGAGADTVEGDGIYSGYFSHFNGSGRYSVEAVVVNDGKARVSTGEATKNSRAPKVAVLNKKNQGHEKAASSFDPAQMDMASDEAILDEWDEEDRRERDRESQLKPIYQFERYASAGAFKLNDFKNGDFVTPSRIKDLKVVEANLPNRTIHLKWTMDNDDENASVTEVRYHEDPLILLKNFNKGYKLHENSQLKELVIEIPAESELQLNMSNNRLYFAVRNRDRANNVGEVSNLALAHFQDPSVTSGIIRKKSQGADMLLWIIIAVAAAIILALVIILVLFKIKSKNKKKKYACQQQEENRLKMNENKQANPLLE